MFKLELTFKKTIGRFIIDLSGLMRMKYKGGGIEIFAIYKEDTIIAVFDFVEIFHVLKIGEKWERNQILYIPQLQTKTEVQISIFKNKKPT